MRCLQNAGDRIVAMMSVESVAIFRTKKRASVIPFPPEFVLSVARGFRWRRRQPGFEGAGETRRRTFSARVSWRASKRRCPNIQGVGWSDHWSFWQEGFPAVMLTDTRTFRNPNYTPAIRRIRSITNGSMRGARLDGRGDLVNGP